MKKVLGTLAAPTRHWVGDGFHVHGMFNYNGSNVPLRSPFLLLDYAAPSTFSPTTTRRGVGQHPHRGFETVTIVYEGEVEHRDSTGNGGIIGRGDVQWMTAGSGILHEEFHSPAFASRGGTFEVVQLWVNLPAKDKTAPAAYQAILDADIPVITLPNDAGTLRLIAGQYAQQHGPARTFTPMHVWDLRLQAGKRVQLPQPEGWSTLLVMLSGTVKLNGNTVLHEKEIATLSQSGSQIEIEVAEDSKCLLLAGEPIHEPVVGYGPFVMNSKQEILQAIDDFNSGKFAPMH